MPVQFNIFAVKIYPTLHEHTSNKLLELLDN